MNRPRNTNGRTRNRAAREAALITAAGKLFASRGYEASTTREIAASADCAEGLIHRYFKGKSGLLLALIRLQVSQEVVDLSTKLPLATNIEDEILQLVNFEVDQMWDNREFLRVVIPRTVVDPTLGQVISRIGPAQRAKAISTRLRKHPESRVLPDMEALADSIGIVGFMYGFMRPVLLGHDRRRAKDMAMAIAKLLSRNFCYAVTDDLSSRNHLAKPA